MSAALTSVHESCALTTVPLNHTPSFTFSQMFVCGSFCFVHLPLWFCLLFNTRLVPLQPTAKYFVFFLLNIVLSSIYFIEFQFFFCDSFPIFHALHRHFLPLSLFSFFSKSRLHPGPPQPSSWPQLWQKIIVLPGVSASLGERWSSAFTASPSLWGGERTSGPYLAFATQRITLPEEM